LGMGPRVLVLFGLVGALACKREASPGEPQPEPEPASEPAVFAELVPSDSHNITSLDLCDHMAAIMLEDTSGSVELNSEDLARFRTNCVAEVDRERVKLGVEKFEREATCVMAADNFPAMEACDPEVESGAEYEALCKHVFTIVSRESGAAPPELGPDMLVECVNSIEREIETMTLDEFARQRECVFQATSIAQLEACEDA
jgi:hypothetical protein